MQKIIPVIKYRKDYHPYPYIIEYVHLIFNLNPISTQVRNIMLVHRKKHISNNTVPLNLDGENLELVSLLVNGIPWDIYNYQLDSKTLSIFNMPDHAEIEIVSQCKPKDNLALMGLYMSGKNFFTQCEPEGFRRITWFADRPDVMSRYKVTLRAVQDYPVLLSNGNLVNKRILTNGQHEVEWEDPFPKPCYLFALVAGQFVCREKSIKTSSGRDILLQVYSDSHCQNETEWAMDCLIRAIYWDENCYGLELDLDRFMIVATHDFNTGAMENKGLNIFNSAYILANENTATDTDYENIESVIAHEYFHNWTGNRITCRDWFQLSLKEGLTVFRDQEFSADMASKNLDFQNSESQRAAKRIDNVIRLKNFQFPEDAGPMSHPIRPNSYQKINNFYTTTIYEKGAEIVRMQHTILGKTAFHEGMQEYLRKYDGKSVTCEDFVSTMESIYSKYNPGKDFSIFRRWYEQAGTPIISVDLHYNMAKKCCTLTLIQNYEQISIKNDDRKPLHIPILIGFLDKNGNEIHIKNVSEKKISHTILLEISSKTKSWVFENIPERPIPSLLRNFSAPVIIDYPYTWEELIILSVHDRNLFSRWAAIQELSIRQLLTIFQQKKNGEKLTVNPEFISVWKNLLVDTKLDPVYCARLFILPNEKILAERIDLIDMKALSTVRDFLHEQIGKKLDQEWFDVFLTNQTTVNSYDPITAGKRSFKNLALNYLASGRKDDIQSILEEQYKCSANMTDRIESLSCLINYCNYDIALEIFNHFYEKWKTNELIIDKWFALQASARNIKISNIYKLMKHRDFNIFNPNRVYSLIFQFCANNLKEFHNHNGSGYQYWTEQILALDKINPEIAANLTRILESWKKFIPELRCLVNNSLEYIKKQSNLSHNVFEIIKEFLEK